MDAVHQGMGPRQRLALAMDERRLELGRTWTAVAKSEHVARRPRVTTTTQTLLEARSGDGGIADTTFIAIDDGLDWERGSARRIFREGGAPVPIEQASERLPLPNVTPLPLTDEQWVHRLDRPDVSPRLRKAILATLAARRREEEALVDLFDALADGG